MDDRDTLRQERLERVVTFGNENKGDWPVESEATPCYARIAKVCENLNKAKVGQLRTPVTTQTLLNALWLDFKGIARTARSIELDELGFAGPYHLPADATEKAIKTHADSLLKLLEDNNAPEADGGDTPAQKTAKAALRAKFVKRFIAPDFVEQLRRDRDAIDGKNTAKTSDNLEGVQSTGDIEALFKSGNEDVIRLDAMMQNLYARDAGKLKAWLAASRVERAPKPKNPPKPPGDTPEPPKPSSEGPAPAEPVA